MSQCSANGQKNFTRTRGNAPFIVFDDADLDAAVDGAIASKYRNTGRRASAPIAFLVQEGVYDAFAGKLVEAVKKLKVGAGFEPGVTQGPLIDKAAVEKVERSHQGCCRKGAKITLGGKRHALGGTFFEPTVLRRRQPADARPHAKRHSVPWHRCSASRVKRTPSASPTTPSSALLLISTAAIWAVIWRVGEAAGIRHRRRQYRDHFDRGGALLAA